VKVGVLTACRAPLTMINSPGGRLRCNDRPDAALWRHDPNPQMDTSILFALTIGLLSAAHCGGMCGSIASAMALGLPVTVRQRPAALLGYNLLYSLGRVASYMVAGAIASVAFASLRLVMPTGGHQLLAGLSSLVLVLIGLYLVGWLPQLRRIEALGQPIWPRLQGLRQKLLPVTRPWQALAFGMIWGWLPCGLVYSTLVWAAANGQPLQGAIYMGLFGIGTLPAVVGVGMAASRASLLFGNPTFRGAIGLLLIAAGLFGLQFNLTHAYHALCATP
jgi:sulfite exporter TauE/SafE